jgi:hypothetical protein
MKGSFKILVCIACLPLSILPASAQNCSTEKVNHENCIVVFDRRYPVTLPTIQMTQGKRVKVVVDSPLEFETLSLDETGATALPGTDQTAAFLTAAAPDLKGLAWSNVTIPPQAEFQAAAEFAFDGGDPDHDQMNAINDELSVLRSLLISAQDAIPDEQHNPELYREIRAVYAQLNQALAPIPKPGSGHNGPFVPPPDAPNTPNPWTDYSHWRMCMLYELVGGNAEGLNCAAPSEPPPAPIPPDFSDVLGAIGKLQARMPTTPPAPAPTDPLFDQNTFDALVKHVESDIKKLTVSSNRDRETAALKKLKGAKDEVNSKIAALNSTLTNVQKDFLTYYQNILLAAHAVPTHAVDENHQALSYSVVGIIGDPQANRGRDVPFLYARFLGRQVVFSLNAVNNILTAEDSVVATTAKVSIATITVLYADPRIETSAGAIISFVHNRTFSNQTITNPPPGSITLAPGDIVVAQTKTDPEVVPFVALHWRLGKDYLMPDHRRGAAYATAWLGLNPYSMVPEYGAGPTFSWRSLMFSFLYNRAHQTALIPGETVGEVVCSPAATVGATPPPCTPAPPAPITQTNAINGFAIGLSVRIPTSFTAGTGGVSR